MDKYTAAIIGCGSIGALKPEKFDSPHTQNALTHAHAMYNNPYIDLEAVFDIDIDRAKAASECWVVKKYGSSIPCEHYDVVTIATPTKDHLETVYDVVMKVEPKIIVLEKPGGNSLPEWRKIQELGEKSNIPIMINYNRRFEKTHQRMKEILTRIWNDPDGEIYGCRVYYGRGLKGDGCHAIDLMNWWFGARERVAWGAHTIKEPNFPPSYGFLGQWKKCPFVAFIPVNSKYMGAFEVEIMTSVGLYSLVYNGLEMQLRPVVQGSDLGDYPELSNLFSASATSLLDTLSNLYTNVVDHLNDGKNLICDITDAGNVWRAFWGVYN